MNNKSKVGILTSMYVRVFLHITFLVEAFTTVLTWVGSGVGVNQ